MIVRTAVLTEGKECRIPKTYEPKKDILKEYAHYYEKEAEDLYEDVKKTMDEKEEFNYDEMSSEEREDIEIRETDRMALALVSEREDIRVDVYLYDANTEAFYVHHDIFLHEQPTSMCVLDKKEDPFVFVSNENGAVVGYNLYVDNHLVPDVLIKAHDSSIAQIEIDGSSIYTADKNLIKAWDIETQKNLFTQEASSSCFAVENNKILYSSGKDIFIHDPREQKASKIFSVDRSVTSVCLSGESICVGTEDGCIYQKKEGTPIKHTYHKERINNLSFLNNRYIFSSSSDESLILYDTENQEVLFKKEIEVDPLTFSFSQDNSLVYVYPENDEELGIFSLSEYIG
ncbi:hypothetical protein NEFER03_0180 [Nematocida sp. LUAm3]|nr:hypothetical protein NEFER03_0180 [Nematocida sp. LUAm3]KAI5173633.1 hypothetical protein NEFER02_0149 [Nematocida sp. LUAm2]KAI5176854.1 hypothetical protein NEFER01_0179 [Nematocida sp. LUAm1]